MGGPQELMVALRAQQPPHDAGGVVMVDGQAAGALADRAPTPLAGQEAVVGVPALELILGRCGGSVRSPG